jgi:hypothetical protein
MITPYSTPLKTEYKPLGLEAFAQPLSQMSEKLETAKSLAANVDFEMSRLNQDDPRSKELMELLEKKTNEIATNLSTSKNYRQATQQIADLNKMFNSDPELSSIKSNYEGYKKMEAEHKARVEKGDISQRDMDFWKMKTLGEFKGTNYNQGEKDYTAISLQPRMKNMEEDMRKESLELARMAVTQQESDLGKYIETSPGVKTRVETTLDYRNLEQVAGEIQRMLATSDKYKDWVQEDADYSFYANSQGPKGQEFQDGVLEGTVGILKNQIASVKDPKQIAALNAQLNQTMAEISQAKETGTSAVLAEKYYKEAATNKFGQLGMAASDLVDFAKLGQKEVQQVDEAAKTRHSDAVKKLEEMPLVTANITMATIQPGRSVSGTATSSAEEEVAYVWSQNTKEQLDNTPFNKIPILSQYPELPEVPGYDETRSTVKDTYIVDLRLGALEKGIKEVGDEITLKEIELSKATTIEDKKLLADERQALVEKKKGVELSLVNEGKTLENLIERNVSNDPELRELWATTAKKDTRTFLGLLQEGNISYLNTVKEGVIDPNPKLDPLSPEGQLAIEAKNKGLIPAGGTLPIMYGTATPKTKLVKFSETLMQDYNWNLSAKLASASTPLEVFGDKSLDTYTGGAVTIMEGYIKNNQSGKSKVERVSMDPATGATTTDPGQQDFDLAAYNPVWHYAGTDQNDHPVVRYVIDRKFTDAATANSYIAAQVRTQKGYAETVSVNAAEVAAWKKANPTDLYIKIPGVTTNASIAVPAEKNYVEYSKTAIAADAGEKYLQNLKNYAQIGLISNPDRRKGYSEMAARIQDAVENKHTATEIIQGPAAFQQNLGPDGQPDGTSSGFVLTYKVEDGAVNLTINKVTTHGSGASTYEPVGRKTLNSIDNLPTQLYSIDLTYGTGAKRDLVHDTSGWQETTYVPAFTNPGVALQGLAK